MDLFYSPKLSFDEGSVEGSHMYALPFCDCPDCEHTKGAASGLQYPWVTGKQIYDARALRRLLWEKSGQGTWAEYVALAAPLKRVLPQGLPTAPGTNFGPWRGKVRSRCEDLVLGGFDTLLMHRSVLAVLARERMAFQTFEIDLRSKKDYNPDLVEVWVPPIGLSCPSSDIRLCQTCNRGSTKLAVCVNASTIPPEAHVFRLRDAPNALIFSQKFVDVCQKLGLGGITFVPIPHEFDPKGTLGTIPLAPTGTPETASRTRPTLTPRPVIKRSQTFYFDWVQKVRSIAECLEQGATAYVKLKISPPATEAEILETEKDLGKKIPSPLRGFFLKGSKGLSFSYLINDLKGRVSIRLEDLSEHRDDVIEWARETWISEEPAQKEIWLSTFPFMHLENGDFLGLEMQSGKDEARVLYLNHEEESSVIAPSFQSFLYEWERLCYIEPKLSQLETYLDQSGHLSGEGAAADSLRSRLNVTRQRLNVTRQP
jgi:hypothetical protein